MNYNIISYFVFFAVVAYVTVFVGRMFFRNGAYFIENLIPEDPHLVQTINRLLLTGYYLLNLGYAAVMITTWDPVNSIEALIATTSRKIGFVVLGLGVMHFKNMFYLKLYKRYRTKIFKNKLLTKI